MYSIKDSSNKGKVIFYWNNDAMVWIDYHVKSLYVTLRTGHPLEEILFDIEINLSDSDIKVDPSQEMLTTITSLLLL